MCIYIRMYLMIKFIKKKKGGAAPMRKTIDSQSIICTTETNFCQLK